MEVYKRALTYKLLTSIEPILATSPVVKLVLDNYERKVMLQPHITTQELKVFLEMRDDIKYHCDYINGPELEDIDSLQEKSDSPRRQSYNVLIASTAVMWLAGTFFTPVMFLSFVIPYALLFFKSKVLEKETLCEIRAQKKINKLQFFERCLLEVDNRDEMIAAIKE